MYAKYFLYITKRANNYENVYIHFDSFVTYIEHVISIEKHCHVLGDNFNHLVRIINTV
jgi:hypothetical protein